MRQELGDEYVEKLFKKFSDVQDQQIDIACYWFRLAHSHIKEKGRAGLVATNSISQGKNRSASLEFIVQKGGYIYEATSTQPWSGEAVVHVSIVNWGREIPKFCHLDGTRVEYINSSLKSTVDVTKALGLHSNSNWCFKGVMPSGKGFWVDEQDVKNWVQADLKNSDVLKQFLNGSALTSFPQGIPSRWIIDFNDLTLEVVLEYELPSERLRQTIPKEREGNRNRLLRENWWKYERRRPDMRKAIATLPLYFAVPETSKWTIFLPCPSTWLPATGVHVVASDDFYTLGILTSSTHRQWVKAQSSTLKSDTRYTNTTCFETFPFPQSPSPKLVEQIRSHTLEIHQYRSEQMEKRQWGITQLYNQFFDEPSSQLRQLHDKLDRLVLKAYGFSPDDDILAKLLELNLMLADREKQGLPVVGPYDPTKAP